jgi:hypothetical protein
MTNMYCGGHAEKLPCATCARNLYRRRQPTQTVSMGDASVEVRYDHQKAEAATREYPGADEDLQITEVLIGDEWVGSEFFSEQWLQDSAVSVLEQLHEEARDAEAEEAERAADARRDDFRNYYP